jgi:Tfp pilus assembly protein PilX
MSAGTRVIRFSKDEKGIALVVTLAVLVIATIMVVGFVSSMRTERQAAATIANTLDASIIAQSAIDHAISILDKNIPQPVRPGASTANPTNWIINPGLLTMLQGTNAPTQIALSSNPSTAYASNSQDADINVPLRSGSGYTILPTSAPMRIAWIPVLKDPTAVVNSTNQITGRYAFWIDDEGAKINVNTAFGKTSGATQVTVGASTYNLGHPASVNIDLLDNNPAGTTLDRVNLAAQISAQGALSSVEGIAPFLSTDSTTYLNRNRFYLTAYSRDPEFNVFGKSRLYMLRAALSKLGNPLFQFFRDRDAPMYFHSDENGGFPASSSPGAPAPTTLADSSALFYTASALTSYFTRNDWPGMPAVSFVDKWAAGSTAPVAQREADQIAWNVIAMGHFADATPFKTSDTTSGSTTTPATPTQYLWFANRVTSGTPGANPATHLPNSQTVIGPLTGRPMIPSFPRPLIDEVCLQISPEPLTQPGKYKLAVSAQYELWLGPGYPACDLTGLYGDAFIGLTRCSYTVTQGATSAAQSFYRYPSNSEAWGIKVLYAKVATNPTNPSPPPATAPLQPGERIIAVASASPPPGNVTPPNHFYVRNLSTGFSSSPNGVASYDANSSEKIHVIFNMRVYLRSQDNAAQFPIQLIPTWDNNEGGIFQAPSDDNSDVITFDFYIDPSLLTDPSPITRSLELADPRDGGIARAWVKAKPLDFDDPMTRTVNTLGSANTATVWDTSKYAYITYPNLPNSALERPSLGAFSFVPTGMQRAVAGAALSLAPATNASQLPDWLLLDLFAPTVSAQNYSDISYLNATAGKVNINAVMSPVPAGASFVRSAPLQAVFQNLDAATTVSDSSSVSSTVDNILHYRLATGAADFRNSAAHNSDTPIYAYAGELCQIAGVSDSGSSDLARESVVRNMVDCLTTRSNVFSVWGVAQTVKKNPANNIPANQGIFETKAGGALANDVVTGEKRFEAVVERYIWQGNDASPGNGHVTTQNGDYDRLSSGQAQPGRPPPYSGGTWETIDGPDAPTYPVSTSPGTWNQSAAASFFNSSLDNANNPLRALMKYRVIYFKYLSE